MRRGLSPIVIPLSVGVAVSVIFFLLASDYALWMRWYRWLPLGQWPVFGDLVMTLEHLELAWHGEDPLRDPESTFGYPRFVLFLKYLRFHEVPAAVLGLIQNLVTVCGIVWVLQPRTWLGAVATALLFVTPPVLLGFERANMDSLLLVLCAVCACVWARSNHPILAGSVIVFAALLKLYPVFALVGGACTSFGRRRLVWLLCLLGVVLYWFGNRDDLALIGSKLDIRSWASWGAFEFFYRLERFFVSNRETFIWLVDVKWPVIAVVAYAVPAVVALWSGSRCARRFGNFVPGRLEWCQFTIGAAIICGSFAVPNYIYRLIFLVPVLPLLITAKRSAERFVVRWARMTLACLVICLCAPLGTDLGFFLIKQAASWMGVLLLLFGGSAINTRLRCVGVTPYSHSEMVPAVSASSGVRPV